MTTTSVISSLKTSTEPLRPHNAASSIRKLSALIFVGVLWFFSTMCKPAEFSQPPPFFLGLHLVTGELLLPDHRPSFFSILRPAARGSGGGRYGWGLHPGAHGCAESAPFLAAECILDYRLLPLVRDPTGFDVPNLGTYEV